MQFKVVIPNNVKSGQTIRIHCPDGTEANVTVPKGLKAGDSFIFEMATDQLNNPKALMDSLKKATPSSSSSTKVDKGKSSGKTSSTKSTKGGNDQSGNDDAVDAQGGSFLDREISNFHDFLLALSVGVVIGLGIVIGFLLGVLYITSDAAGAANAAKGHLAGKGTGEIRSPPGIPSGESLMNLNRVR